MTRVKKESNKKVQATFNKDQMAIIHKYRGLFGIEDAEIVRNIVIDWLADKEYASGIISKK